MSYGSRKGYAAEHLVEQTLQSWGHEACYRPRAGRHDDIGDIAGVPLVVSVKAHQRLALATFVTDLTRMVGSSGLATGVVWHKKVGKGNPLDWYITTSGHLFKPLYDAFCEVNR